MRNRSHTAKLIRVRAVALLSALIMAGGALSACSGENADVNCSLDACVVTFNRGVDASASVLGVDIKLMGVEGGNVTLDVEGSQITVPVNGEADAEGRSITVQEVTSDKVVVRIATGG